MLVPARERSPAAPRRLPHGTCDDDPRERRAAGGLGPPRGGAGTSGLDSPAGLGAAAAAAVRAPGAAAVRPAGAAALCPARPAAGRLGAAARRVPAAAPAAEARHHRAPTAGGRRDPGRRHLGDPRLPADDARPQRGGGRDHPGPHRPGHLVASLVLTGILTVAVSRAVLGQSISARDAWNQARPRLPALLGVTGLVLLIMLGLAVLAVAPGVILAIASAPTAAVVIAFVLGIPAFVVVAAYLYTAFALAPPAIVLERQ